MKDELTPLEQIIQSIKSNPESWRLEGSNWTDGTHQVNISHMTIKEITTSFIDRTKLESAFRKWNTKQSKLIQA